MADNKTQIIITAKDETRAAIQTAQSGLQSLTAQAASLGLQLGALGGAASLGGIALMAKDAIDAADSLGKMSQKLGISVEQLSALEYAGKLSDVSLDSMATAIKKLSVGMNDFASGGTSEAAEAFQALGISVTDASGKLRGSDDVLGDIAESFANMKDGAGKTAIAVALFGRAGADMIPMLNGGKKALEEMNNEAKVFGVVVGEDMSKTAEAFNDNLTRLGEAARGVGISVAGQVLPTMLQLSQEFVNAAKEGDGFSSLLGGTLKKTLEKVAVLGANVVYVFKAIGAEIGGIAAQMAALAQGDFQGFKFIGEAMKEDAAKARAEIDALEKRLLNPAALPDAPSKDGKGDAPITGKKGGSGKFKSLEKELEEARKKQAAAIMAVHNNAEAAAEADVLIEKEKADRIMAVVKETYDGKLAVLQDELKAAAALLDEGLINDSQWQEYANVRIEAFNKTKDAGVDAFKELERAIEGWGKASADAFVEFAFTGKASFSDMVNSILKDMAKMIVYQNVTSPIAKSISGGIESAGGIGGFLSGLFGGGRANGGPVVPGQYYVVGENGPEVLVPNTAGTVIPNGGAMGGGTTSNITINVDASGTRAEGDAGEARELARRIESAVRGVLMVEKRPGGMLA